MQILAGEQSWENTMWATGEYVYGFVLDLKECSENPGYSFLGILGKLNCVWAKLSLPEFVLAYVAYCALGSFVLIILKHIFCTAPDRHELCLASFQSKKDSLKKKQEEKRKNQKQLAATLKKTDLKLNQSHLQSRLKVKVLKKMFQLDMVNAGMMNAEVDRTEETIAVRESVNESCKEFHDHDEGKFKEFYDGLYQNAHTTESLMISHELRCTLP